MARTLNPEAHASRRDEFVDVAQRLIATRGYEQLSVQEILDELGASKGAFYHYFGSKADLLEAVVDRMTSVAVAAGMPVVDDPTIPAVEKLRRLFADIASWKLERRDLVLELLRVWFSDDNAVMRDKFRTGMRIRLTPVLARVIAQGKAEGTFTVTSPEQAAGMLVSLLQGANDSASHLFLERQANVRSLAEVEEFLSAYAEAFERVLGLPAGTAPILDPSTVRVWFG